MSAGRQAPGWARALIERVLPAEMRETVSADLDEMFERRVARDGVGRARAWYAAQAVAFTGRFGRERLVERVRGKRTGGRSGSDGGPIRFSLLDWKLGFRMLIKYPGLSIIAGLALATGIALGAGYFQVTMMELWPKLPFDDGDRIVRIENWDAAAMDVEGRSLHDFLAWRAEVTSVVELGAALTTYRNIVGSNGRAVPELVAEMTASAFPLTRVPPLLGRPLTEADEQVGAPDVVVLSHGVWQARFAGEPDILGRVVQVGRTRATVVGVMPEGFAFPEEHRAWVPLRVSSALQPLEGPPVQIFGRLADGVKIETAEAELAAYGQRMAASNPDTHARLQPKVFPFAAPPFGGVGLLDALLLNLIGFLVMTALCANVASLMFARTAMRESEVVVRTALGASRGRIIGQMLVEVLVLALIAAAAGLAFLSRLIDIIMSDVGAFWMQPELRLSTVVYAIGLAVLGSALVAILPALKATGSRVQEGLRNASGGSTNMRFGRLWSGIIVFQVAVTVMALPVGINFMREALRDYRARAGFPSADYLTFRPGFDADVLGAEATVDEVRGRAAAVFAELERRLEAEPGVLAVTFAGGLPGMWTPTSPIEAQRGSEAPWPVEGYLQGGNVITGAVDVDFFDAFRIPVMAGRGFNNGDVGAPNARILVNESLAEKLGGNPLGVRLRVPGFDDLPPGPWLEVVGVVKNVGLHPTDEGEADFLYEVASFEEFTAPVVGVRMNGEPGAVSAKLESMVAEIDPAFRVHQIAMLDQVLRVQERGNVLGSLAATGVNVLCILLSAASLFAVMAVGVARRTREIGIRLALGASKRGVLAALFSRAAKQLAAGVVVGNVVFAGALAYYDAFEQEYLLSVVVVSMVMALVGLLACAVPARRALRIRPTQALRE